MTLTRYFITRRIFGKWGMEEVGIICAEWRNYLFLTHCLIAWLGIWLITLACVWWLGNPKSLFYAHRNSSRLTFQLFFSFLYAWLFQPFYGICFALFLTRNIKDQRCRSKKENICRLCHSLPLSASLLHTARGEKNDVAKKGNKAWVKEMCVEGLDKWEQEEKS